MTYIVTARATLSPRFQERRCRRLGACSRLPTVARSSSAPSSYRTSGRDLTRNRAREYAPTLWGMSRIDREDEVPAYSGLYRFGRDRCAESLSALDERIGEEGMTNEIVLFDGNGRRVRPTGSSLMPNGDVSEWFAVLMFEAIEASGQKITEARIRIYAAEFADRDPIDVVRAVRRARRESKFFPQISEIVQQLGPSGDDRALLTWNALERLAAAAGSYQQVDIDDPCAAAALVAVFGNWPAFCAMEKGPELMVKRQAYLAAHREARRTVPDRAQPTTLPGLLDASSGWSARLTLSGEIETKHERPALPEAPIVNRLTSGEE